MASVYVQMSLLAVIVTALATFAYGLPPFEIRSTNMKSEGSEEWMRHLEKSQACRVFSRAHPTFLCSSTKMSAEPECIQGRQLCNGTPDCPQGEDESSVLCIALGFLAQKDENDISWRG